MKNYSDKELELINIQIGCILRLERLKRGMSQHDLSLEVNTDPTTVGRLERFEHGIRWEKTFKLSQYFKLDFCNLFDLRDLEYLQKNINSCIELEKKLTQIKKEYYKNLEIEIKKRFGEIS